MKKISEFFKWLGWKGAAGIFIVFLILFFVTTVMYAVFEGDFDTEWFSRSLSEMTVGDLFLLVLIFMLLRK